MKPAESNHLCQLKLERLESREVPVIGISLAGGVLRIVGDELHNHASVWQENGRITLRVDSIPLQGGMIARHLGRSASFASASIKQIQFFGGGGNDSFHGLTTKPCYLNGGTGHDSLLGGQGNDSLYGGSDNDYLYGQEGNDRLFGENGDDELYGHEGRDALLGGAGSDKLHGGDGSDRFLVMYRETEPQDVADEDAVLVFRNDVRDWTYREILLVEGGFLRLHQETGNDELLETADGDVVTFWRGGNLGRILADNDSEGRVNVYSGAFRNPSWTAAVIIHEMAHNWDTEHSAGGHDWTKWTSLSGWRYGTPPESEIDRYLRSPYSNWWYLKTASGSFARSYGKTSPYEDFATSWEWYFTVKYGLANSFNLKPISSAKSNYLSGLFEAMS